ICRLEREMGLHPAFGGFGIIPSTLNPLTPSPPSCKELKRADENKAGRWYLDRGRRSLGCPYHLACRHSGKVGARHLELAGTVFCQAEPCNRNYQADSARPAEP